LPVFHIPGEHDVLDEGAGKFFLDRYGASANGAKVQGKGWYSFDHGGVHFVALVNVLDLKAGGLGSLGADQLAWLKADLAGRGALGVRQVKFVRTGHPLAIVETPLAS